MTRTRALHNSPLHTNTGTGLVPPLEVLQSVVFFCGWASASFFAFVLGFVFGNVLEQLVFAANAVGLRFFDTVTLPLPTLLRVGYRAISDIDWYAYALLRICLRFAARSDKRLCDLAGAVLDLFARPDVQLWLIVVLQVATALIWIYVLYSVVSLSLYFFKARSRDGASASVEDVQCEEEEQCPCAACHLQRMRREYFWLVLDFKDIYEPISQDAVGSDVDAEVVEDRQHLHTEDWAEQVSLGDDVADGEVPAGWDGVDEVESRDAEEFSEEAGPSDETQLLDEVEPWDEAEPLDEVDFLNEVEPLDEEPPLHGAEPLDEAAPPDSSEPVDVDYMFASVGSASNAYSEHCIPVTRDDEEVIQSGDNQDVAPADDEHIQSQHNEEIQS
ncbi:hypothetical protein BDW22DRAFT_1228241 [Trametopsis cervina]|nr:hypothetical protein BDW22DRAFT_1228241 [Trametopsis cervina]